MSLHLDLRVLSVRTYVQCAPDSVSTSAEAQTAGESSVDGESPHRWTAAQEDGAVDQHALGDAASLGIPAPGAPPPALASSSSALLPPFQLEMPTSLALSVACRVLSHD